MATSVTTDTLMIQAILAEIAIFKDRLTSQQDWDSEAEEAADRAESKLQALVFHAEARNAPMPTCAVRRDFRVLAFPGRVDDVPA